MQIYLVGGAVRDELLGISVQERDYVVVGAEETELRSLGFLQLNSAFPVFLHPETRAEYALARRERKVGIGYKGFIVETGPDVTLEEDLARRDLTVNAMAQDADGRIFDPFHGYADLQAGRLRHITQAFQEDPVRLLRIARFAAKFWHLNFRIAQETLDLLPTMATEHEMTSLLPQRFHAELLKALATDSPWCFFEILKNCNALGILFPGLAAAMGTGHTDNEHISPIMMTLQRAVTITQNVQIRLTALLASLVTDPPAAVALCRKLKLENNVTDLLTSALNWQATKVAQATPETILEFLEKRRLFHNPHNADLLMQIWLVLDPSNGQLAQDRLTVALQATTNLDIKTLQAQGLVGPALGAALRQQRLLAIANAMATMP